MNDEIRLEIPDNIYLFLDIDGVLATTRQYLTNRKKWHPEYNRYKFDEGCVKVFNSILEKHPMIIILSSDWKLNYSLEVLNTIFEINGVKAKVSDITPNLWGVQYFRMSELEECRAEEILKYQTDHANIIDKWLAIDDLNLTQWMPDNFIRTPRANEGIKQSGIKDKIYKLINQL